MRAEQSWRMTRAALSSENRFSGSFSRAEKSEPPGGRVERESLPSNRAIYTTRKSNKQTRSIFQHQIHPRLVVEVGEQADDVGVSESRVDLDLALQLVSDVLLLEDLLVKHLQRHDFVFRLGSGHVHASEEALPERPSDFEIVQGECRLLRGGRRGGGSRRR